MGKSRRHSVKKKWYQRVSLTGLSVISVVSFVAVSLWKEARERQEKKDWSVVKNLIVIEAERSQIVDGWWIKTSPLATIETQQLLEKKKNEILGILQKNRGISAQTERIASRFKEFRTAVFIDGEVRHLNEKGIEVPLKATAIEICFMPEDRARRNLEYSFEWRPHMNTVVAPAYEYPEKLLAAILYHELGHALLHNKNDSGGHLVADSEEKVLAEEVLMHQFSGDILNSLTGGAYYRKIDEILQRRPTEKRFERILTAITAEDREAFDAMFGCVGKESPSKMLASNYCMIIGFRVCERCGLGVGGKIAVYNKFTKFIK